LTCLSCMLDKMSHRTRDKGDGKMSKFRLGGTLKTLRTVPDPDHPDGVLFSLIFHASAEQSVADAMLATGAAALDADATWKLTGEGNGFERTIQGVLQKMSAACDDEAAFKVAFTIQSAADLDELHHLWADFLPQVGTSMLVVGEARQQELALAPKKVA